MKHFAQMVLALSLALAPMEFLGGCENWQRSVESRKETVRDGLAALREMVFETMQDRIGKLAENRAFYCRKGNWPWKAHSLDRKELCLDRFDVVKTDEDPPDDGVFGNELIDLLRKCTTGDAVFFESIKSRIVDTVGLAWIGKDGSSLAGMAAITTDEVYFVYTVMGLVTEKTVSHETYDKQFRSRPPYYAWRDSGLAQHIWLADEKRLRVCMKRIYSKLEKMYPDSRSLRESFLFAKSITAFRIDIAPEKFQAARHVCQESTKEVETK